MPKYYSNILEILKERSITQKQFAEMLNIPKSTLNDWLIEKTEPPFEMLEKSADLLKISIDKDIFKREFK